METTLRRGQEDALSRLAQVLSASSPASMSCLSRSRLRANSIRSAAICSLRCSDPPLLDGFADEWPQPARAVPGFDASNAGAEAAEPKVRLGVHGRSMHVYVEVAQPSVRYEVPTRDETRPADKYDRVIVLTHDEFGHERAWSVSAIAPGPVLVRACEIGAPWKPSADEVPYVEGRGAKRQGLRARAARATQPVRNATQRAGARR